MEDQPMLEGDGQIKANTAVPRISCDFCKTRKIKCEGSPQCAQCHKRGIQCTFKRLPSKPNSVLVQMLSQKLEQLAVELDEQKKIADHWRQLYEENKKSQSMEIVYLRRPNFSTKTNQFCSNVKYAVSVILKATTDLKNILIAFNTDQFNNDSLAMVWNRLVDSQADEAGNKILSMPLDLIAQFAVNSAMFAFGTTSGSIIHYYFDLSAHFQRITDILTSYLLAHPLSRTDEDVAKQVVIANIYSLLCFKMHGDFTKVSDQYQRAKDFVDALESKLDDVIIEEIKTWLIPVGPIDCAIPELCMNDNETPRPCIKQRLWLTFVSLTKFQELEQRSGSAAQELWYNVSAVELALEQVRGLPVHRFLSVIVHGLKAVAAVNLPEEFNSQVYQGIQLASHLYAQISNRSEQVWLSRDFEYLHHVLLTLHQQFTEYRSLNLMLDVVENIIVLIAQNGVTSERATVVSGVKRSEVPPNVDFALEISENYSEYMQFSTSPSALI